jgi:hypothetical protein
MGPMKDVAVGLIIEKRLYRCQMGDVDRVDAMTFSVTKAFIDCWFA